MQRFSALVFSTKNPAGTWHFAEVPFDVEAVFGQKSNVPVKGTVNGVAFASTLFARADGAPHQIFLNKQLLKLAGVRAGDTIAVALERDERPREIVVPEDLELLLEEEGLRGVFDSLVKGRRKYLVDLVEGAKHMDTRIRRLGKCIELIHKWVAEKNNPTT